MAYDMFIDIDGIPGESTDSKLKDKIDVFGFSWGVAQQGSLSHGNTNAVGKADIRSLRFLKRTDASSHLLFINCVTGAYIKQATLIVRKQGGNPLEFLKIQMSDIFVESFELTGKPRSDNTHPEEEVGLAFSTIKMLYARQKDERTLDAYKEVGWSVKENKRL
ncbi:Hcp family type VI secretion system effector [Niveispirillum sp. KHB5.9]|uniref:Hcp family type VI secretion system effector n=1 Tax=Niveispirillum sp. KHB5.9 TaxID=3400269 RepID=UPI003A88D987